MLNTRPHIDPKLRRIISKLLANFLDQNIIVCTRQTTVKGDAEVAITGKLRSLPYNRELNQFSFAFLNVHLLMRVKGQYEIESRDSYILPVDKEIKIVSRPMKAEAYFSGKEIFVIAWDGKTFEEIAAHLAR